MGSRQMNQPGITAHYLFPTPIKTTFREDPSMQGDWLRRGAGPSHFQKDGLGSLAKEI
jgi:hypothetical protein